MSVVGHNVIFPTVIGVCRRKDLVIPVKEAVAKCDDYQGMKSTTNYALNETTLQKELVEEVKQYLASVLHINQNIKMTTSWWTKVNESNCWDLHYHNHPNSWFSAVFYFEDNCDIDFTREDPQTISVVPELYTALTSTLFSMTLNAGDLIIFPSNVLHKAQFAGTDRQSLAMNLMPVGLIGEGHSECVYG